jgi:DNA modification methylase
MVKPVKLVADAILDCSARGEVVLDAFGGSGTTLMAAERTGRRGFLLELDPLYVDTVIRRWEAYTGDTARHRSFVREDRGRVHVPRGRRAMTGKQAEPT